MQVEEFTWKDAIFPSHFLFWKKLRSKKDYVLNKSLPKSQLRYNHIKSSSCVFLLDIN